jgi:hypothetical protein
MSAAAVATQSDNGLEEDNFVMIPQNIPLWVSGGRWPGEVHATGCILIHRGEWMNSKCINAHDYQSPIYELTNECDRQRAVPKNFFHAPGVIPEPSASQEPGAGREALRVRYKRAASTGAHNG